jgi:hypothetical protein
LSDSACLAYSAARATIGAAVRFPRLNTTRTKYTKYHTASTSIPSPNIIMNRKIKFTIA